MDGTEVSEQGDIAQNGEIEAVPQNEEVSAEIEGAPFTVDTDDISYFIGRESIIAGKAPGMHPLREELFVLLNRGADSASRFFNLPNDRIFEVGSQVEI